MHQSYRQYIPLKDVAAIEEAAEQRDIGGGTGTGGDTEETE